MTLISEAARRSAGGFVSKDAKQELLRLPAFLQVECRLDLPSVRIRVNRYARAVRKRGALAAASRVEEFVPGHF